ncbi:unnamed protein product [Mytilus edulis]|uniref:Ig-like domain-containing protein n=1 Tax=Mytilus edulis TaxID=6550 RepID=A0A8S3R7N5_MYTED|nr:unnamed protein product [Mytilus edulis]
MTNARPIFIHTAISIDSGGYRFVNGSVSWSLTTKPAAIGKDIELHCDLDNDTLLNNSSHWSKGENVKVLILNGETINDTKYSEKLDEAKRTSILTITSLDTDDVNVPYTCQYGFQSNCNEYVDIDNNILDFCNVPNIEQSLVNNLHILEECGIPVVRQSQDKYKVDKYGKKLLELCRSLELFFVNGRLGNDKDIGLTTCNYSVIDYAIVSPNLFRSIVDFNVLIFDPILSDIHKPICLHLCTNLTCVVDVDLNNSNVNDNDMDNTNDSNIVITLHGESESIVKPIWARDRAPVFTENLDDTSIDELLNKLEDIDPQNTDNVTVNNVVNDCVNIIRNAAEQANMFVKINDKNVKKKCNSQFVHRKKYFNSECYIKRKNYRRSKKYYYRVRSTINYDDLVCKSREYKKTLKTQYNESQKAFISKLRGLRTTDPKSYWSLLNKGCEKGKNVSQKVAL